MGTHSYIVFRTKKNNVYSIHSIIYHHRWGHKHMVGLKLVEFIRNYNGPHKDDEDNDQLVDFTNMIVEYYEDTKKYEDSTMSFINSLGQLESVVTDWDYYVTWDFDAKKLMISVNDSEDDGCDVHDYESVYLKN